MAPPLERSKRASTSSRCSSTPPEPTSRRGSCRRGTTRTPRLHRSGQGRGAATASVRQVDADTVVFDDELSPGPAAQPGEDPRPDRDRPHGGDPRHLRPERPHRGGAGPGRAGAAAIPAAAPPGPGPGLVAAGRWHRHPGPRRDPARGRPAPDHAPDAPSSRSSCAKLEANAPHPTSARRRGALAGSRSSGTPTPASRPCSTRSPMPTCSSRTGSSPPSIPRTRRLELPGGETVLVLRHGGLRPQASPSARRGLPLDPRGRRRLGSARPHRRRARPLSRRTRWTRCGRCSARSVPVGSRNCSCSTRSTRIPTPRSALRRLHQGARDLLGAHRRGDRPAPRRRSRPSCASPTVRSSSRSPMTEVTCSPRCTVRARWLSADDEDGHTSCGRGSTRPRDDASPSSSACRAARRLTQTREPEVAT